MDPRESTSLTQARSDGGARDCTLDPIAQSLDALPGGLSPCVRAALAALRLIDEDADRALARLPVGEHIDRVAATLLHCVSSPASVAGRRAQIERLGVRHVGYGSHAPQFTRFFEYLVGELALAWSGDRRAEQFVALWRARIADLHHIMLAGHASVAPQRRGSGARVRP